MTKVEVQLFYTIFADWPVIARSSKVINQGRESCYLGTLASLSLDLPDADYD